MGTMIITVPKTNWPTIPFKFRFNFFFKLFVYFALDLFLLQRSQSAVIIHDSNRKYKIQKQFCH